MVFDETEELINIFRDHPEIKLVYLFGSQVGRKAGVLSDVDFALYVDEKDHQTLYDLKLVLIDKLCLLLKTDKVDVVILNLSESPELKYIIIKNGKLIFEREPFKLLVEPQILNEYFDFYSMLLRHNLTRASS